MGPNVVQMIKNVGYNESEYPFAATLMGDHQYPFSDCIASESNQYLIDELAAERGKEREMGKNRFLFKKPLQFFEEDFSFECTVPGSVLNRFQDWKQLRKSLEDYQ